MKQTQQRRNLFTCTFCHGIYATSPEVVGRSARLSCSGCATAVLDLAVCWTCGELVLRGDECVSLGWCFWHRACYGCLLYGSRRVCAGVPVRALFESNGGRGKEIKEPPLCAMCLAEVEVDRLDGETVVSKGLRRIDVVDGGVTRTRWARKEGQCRASTSKRRPATNGSSSDGTPQYREASSVIWVDIHDPINGFTFKPNPLKPFPLFMQPRTISAFLSHGRQEQTQARTLDNTPGRCSPHQSRRHRASSFHIQETSSRRADVTRHSEPCLLVS